MAQQDVLEAQVPLLRSVPAADAHIQHVRAGGHWLHSSPEAALKFLLASVAAPLYYLGPVFREGEQGRLHQPEFTMLEWYMPGYDLKAIARQLGELLGAVGLDMPPPQVEDYTDTFVRHLEIDPFCTDIGEWRRVTAAAGLECDSGIWQDYRDLLLASFVLPKLGHSHPVLLHGFPHQPSLQAKLLPGAGDSIDDRFELIVCGVEIADGCRELNDPEQLLQRQPEPDPLLLQALEAGMPDCIGTALGVDRLLAVLRHRQGHELRLDALLPWRDGSPP